MAQDPKNRETADARSLILDFLRGEAGPFCLAGSIVRGLFFFRRERRTDDS